MLIRVASQRYVLRWDDTERVSRRYHQPSGGTWKFTLYYLFLSVRHNIPFLVITTHDIANINFPLPGISIAMKCVESVPHFAKLRALSNKSLTHLLNELRREDQFIGLLVRILVGKQSLQFSYIKAVNYNRWG